MEGVRGSNPLSSTDLEGPDVSVRPFGVPAVLEARGIPVPEAARERILAQKDPERLRRWVGKAVVAASVDEVIGPR